MMNTYSINDSEENKDKLKSGIITAVIWSVLLLFVFLYKFIPHIPEKQEVITSMLINFGDNRNGNGAEEPANQEGSLAAKASPNVEETPVEMATKIRKSETSTESIKKEAPKEKILTGNDSKNAVKTVDKADKNSKSSAKAASAKSNSKTSGSKATTANSNKGNGDGKGNAAIGNFMRGRGTNTGSQGNNGTVGNAGDPLGGDGNGDSRIGVDRKLTGYIPGTMGRGGSQPSHSCSASGSITISYTVDKAGNVTSARRSGGISDACVASTSIAWVKKYVKAEKASSSSTGTYKISF